MGTLLTVNQFLNDFKNEKSKLSLDEFLLKHWNTDLDGEGCCGWKYKGKETTDIEEAKKWYHEKK